MDAPARHLRLLTETIAAVNSTLDLEEVLALVARKVAQAHLDPRFKAFSNLPEDEYESILAVPILAREKLAGALNIRTRRPREFGEAEIELLVAIAAQVAQTIEHAQLYAEAQRRVGELEALARISEAVSESLYLEESLEAIVTATMEAVGATGAALVLEDGGVARPEGRAGAFAVRIPLRWKGRQIGELVCDRDTDFTVDERALLASIAHHAAVALEHGRAVMRGVLAQEIHHRVKNNLQTVASLLRLQARSADAVDPRAVLEPVELPGVRATALALVFAELLQNALEHGGDRVRVELARAGNDVVLAIADDGVGIGDGGADGTGLSIVRALVRDELRGTLELRSDAGTRVEV